MYGSLGVRTASELRINMQTADIQAKNGLIFYETEFICWHKKMSIRATTHPPPHCKNFSVDGGSLADN